MIIVDRNELEKFFEYCTLTGSYEISIHHVSKTPFANQMVEFDNIEDVAPDLILSWAWLFDQITLEEDATVLFAHIDESIPLEYAVLICYKHASAVSRGLCPDDVETLIKDYFNKNEGFVLSRIPLMSMTALMQFVAEADI